MSIPTAWQTRGHDIEFFSVDVPTICWTRSFYGLAGTRSCFYGVFKVLSRRPGNEGPIPDNCPWVTEAR